VTRTSLAAATADVAARDPVLANLVELAGPVRWRPRDPDGHFGALVRSIVFQQLAGRAAQAIYGRVRSAVGDALTPETLHGGRRCEMATIPHEPSGVFQEKRRWSLQLLVPEMWASLAIIVIWLAVLFDAVFGPHIVNASAGGDRSVIPSAVALALFAFLATWPVARYGFHRERRE
jgi:hypothetical protein